MKRFFWQTIGSFLRPFEWRRRQWANERYFERQARWRQVDYENQQMAQVFKAAFDRELTNIPRLADDSLRPPYPEVERAS